MSGGKDVSAPAVQEPSKVHGGALDDGWLPIETAPRDGTRLFLLGQFEDGPEAFVGFYNEKDSDRDPFQPFGPFVWKNVLGESAATARDCVTHWMPIPPARLQSAAPNLATHSQQDSPDADTPSAPAQVREGGGLQGSQGRAAWQIIGDDARGGVPFIDIGEGEFGTLSYSQVCEVAPDFDEKKDAPDDFFISERTRARAHLIAAAPDLYAACKRLLASINAHAETGEVHPHYTVETEEARAALSKARGEAQ